jgi:hypothetical protein
MTTMIETAERPTAGAPAGRGQLRANLIPLIVDVAVPVGGYYLLRALGVAMVTALAVASVPPLVHSVAGYIRRRHVDALALLILAVNVAGIATSFLTGNARVMMAKDSVLSSVIGIGALVSVWRGAPVMTAGLKPYLTKGRAARVAAYERLSAGSARFRRLERRYTLVWGVVLLVGDSLARLVCVALLPVSTMVWLSTVLVVTAVAVAIVVSGATAAEPMQRLIRDDSDEDGATR